MGREEGRQEGGRGSYTTLTPFSPSFSCLREVRISERWVGVQQAWIHCGSGEPAGEGEGKEEGSSGGGGVRRWKCRVGDGGR